jgi:eukaryotic-like serine/threonine-protein kinase
MPLATGTKLGHYEILASLGAGGMGEVYLAKDTKLDRKVAIKVLPKSLAQDSDRLARFEREAKVLASLNHPNIAAIYGVEERALVMELVAGETLRGPLPIETALNYAKQIAEALEAAHEKGIVHRDLKPANIMVTPEGVVKVLDFGLAAIPLVSAPESGDPANPATLSMRATQAGMIIGTAAYMSPEQAAGKEVDKRADIWSFGVVLWEILTGERLFGGETVSHSLAAVLKDEPDWSRVAPAVRPLLRKCLERDPRKRLRDIGDAMALLPVSVEHITIAPPPSRLGAGVWVIAWVPLAALAALAFVHFRETPGEGKLITATILPPDNAAGDATYGSPEISPDGKRIVFRLHSGGKAQLWMRPLDSSTAQALPGTEDGADPFWSPDSRSIAFFADGKLKRIDLPGGVPLTVAAAPLGNGGSWSDRGIIVFAPATLSGLERVPATGGSPVPIELGPGTRYPVSPSFLPDGRHFLFLDLRDAGDSEGVLKISSLDSREVKTLGPANSAAVYGNGRLLFVRGPTLIAQPFDERRLDTAKEIWPVAQNVRAFSASRDGTLIYQGGDIGAQQLTWFDRNATASGALGEPGNFYTFEFSPEQKKIAASVGDDIWIQDVSRGLRLRFTFTSGIDTNPVWSPDGRSIAFCSNRSGRYGIYRKSSDFSGAEDTLYSDSIDTLTDSWSPDGKSLMVHRRDPATLEDLAVLPQTSHASGAALKLAPFIKTPFRELHGRFSPDGRWVAYVSNESQRSEIYVALFPGPGGRQQVSTTGGTQPRWRADGKELFFVSGGGTLMAAEVAIKENEAEVGSVRSLGIPVVRGRGWLYDVSADGKRFLVAVPTEQKAASLTLVSNWPLLLRK